MLNNGFGEHRIEGIGDRRIPWIHNVRNTDIIIGIDDSDVINIFNLFNSVAGREYLNSKIGLNDEYMKNLNYIGLSSIANIISAIKFSKYYELSDNDIILTVLTDSSDLYQSRLREKAMCDNNVNDTFSKATLAYHKSLIGQKTDYIEELTYRSKKRIHNLKYFTWIEQHGFYENELNAQWYDYSDYWGDIHSVVDELDRLIMNFNNSILG